MPIRRLTSAALVAVFLTILGATAGAQFGNILKTIPKGPMPTAPKASVDPPKSTLDCSKIDDALVDKVIKAHAIRKKVYDDEVAKANAKKAQADALSAKRAQISVHTMMENGECKDAFKEKDARMKEIRRLEDLVAAANDRGDEAKAAELSRKLDPLNQALELDADRACGGKSTAAFTDCLEKKTAELRKQGLAGPMLQIQAQSECVSDPTTSGVAGASGPSDEEQALDAEYQQIMKGANEKADKAKADATGLDEHQRAMFAECVIGVINLDPAVMSQTTLEARGAIRKRADDLDKAVH